MQRIPRRTFLMSAGAAPLAFALSGRAGANDRIRAALIGMGDGGRDHVELLSGMEEVEIAAFCDPDEHRMEEKASEFQSRGGKRPKLEPDLRRHLDDRDIDVITIAAPNHWQALGRSGPAGRDSTFTSRSDENGGHEHGIK